MPGKVFLADSALVVKTETSSPLADSELTIALPIKPVAPVTNILTCKLFFD